MSKTFYSAPIIAILYFSNNLANSGIQILKKIIINGDNTEDGLIESSHVPLACAQGRMEALPSRRGHDQRRSNSW